MGKGHLSRIAAPRRWVLKRKETKWVIRPAPGPHALDKSITLNTLLKDYLKYTRTAKESKKILNDKKILVDKYVRKSYKFPVGLMDVIEVPSLKECYRVSFGNKGRIVLVNVDDKKKNLKLLKVIGKKILKKGKLQINFHDGKNLLVDKFDGKVGDSCVYDLDKKKIVKKLAFEKGMKALLVAGKHAGSICVVKDVIREGKLQNPKLLFELEGKDYLTLLSYAFIVGKTKPEVNLEVKK